MENIQKKLSEIYLALLVLIPVIVFPTHIHLYEYPKWLVFYVINLIVGIIFLFKKYFYLPQLSSKEKKFILLLAWIFSLSTFANYRHIQFTNMIQWLTFIFSTLFCFNLVKHKEEFFLKRIYFYIILGTIPVVLMQWLQILEIDFGFLKYFPFKKSPGLTTHFPSLFGAPHYTAEFLGISSLVQVFDLFRHKSKHFFDRYARPLLLGITLVSLHLYYSRSVMLSFTFVGIFIFIHYKQELKDRYNHKRFLVIFLTILFTLAIPSAFEGYSNAGETIQHSNFLSTKNERKLKSSSTSKRIVLNMNALYMMWDNIFLGTGTGTFKWMYPKYKNAWKYDYLHRENQVVRSPHNGYLELAAETGLPFALTLMAFFWFWFMKLKAQKFKNQEKNELRTFVYLCGLFLLVHTTFSFPFEITFPFFFYSMVFGLALALTHQVATIKHSQYIPLICIIPLLYLTPISSFSNRHMSRFKYSQNKDRTHFICRWYPDEYQLCKMSARIYAKDGNYKKTLKIIKDLREKYPYLISLIKEEAMLMLRLRRFQEGCALLKKYESYFKGKTTVSVLRQKRCRSLNYRR